MRRLGERAEVAGQHLVEEPRAPLNGKRGLSAQEFGDILAAPIQTTQGAGFHVAVTAPFIGPKLNVHV